jgi:hypothetical protein
VLHGAQLEPGEKPKAVSISKMLMDRLFLIEGLNVKQPLASSQSCEERKSAVE